MSATGLTGIGGGTVPGAPSIAGSACDGIAGGAADPGGVGTGEVRGVVLRGNVFINHVNPAHPLRSSMQAIGCFDGWFVNWVVENNVVVTDHWHGISFYGMCDSRIVNNTVIDLDPVNDYAHFGLGLCLLRAGDKDTARGHLKLAVIMRPDNEDYEQALRQASA